jgi:hypothetical protein
VSAGERLLPQVALATTIAAGIWAAFTSAMAMAIGHTEGVDSAAFLFAFAILLPAAAAVVVRGGPLKGVGLARIAAVAAIGLALVLAVARFADEIGGGEEAHSAILLGLTGVWLGGVAVLWSRARSGSGPSWLDAADSGGIGWLPLTVVPVLLWVLAWDVLPGAGGIVLSLILAAALAAADRVLSDRDVPRWATIAIDVVAGAAIVLLVADVAIFTPEAASWGLQLHHDSMLGPVNDVLRGREMLVDTYSIYGVGNVYFLAGLFEILPLGYGSFGILVGAGLAVMYAGAYAILRAARCSQVLALTAMAAAVVSSVYTTIGSPATFPSLGVLRWGFGLLLVGFAVWSVRSPRRAPGLRIASSVVVGLSSIWSFEVFAYTAATFAAVVAYDLAAARPSIGWPRAVLRSVMPAVGACLIAHLALIAWTLIASGQFPDWGPYLAMVREYSSGELNRIVAPPWWVGVAVGGFLFASGVAVAAIVARAPRFEAENRPALVAITGLTAFGIVVHTYGVRFSSEDYVARADLPSLMVMALWVELALRSGLARPARVAIAAAGFSLAALLMVAGGDHLEREAGRSALIAALPGNGRSVESEVSHAWDNPAVQPRAPVAEMLLDRYWSGADRALVLLNSDLAVEALMRTERLNLLPVSAVLADDVIAEESWERVGPAVDAIEPGTLMLTESFYLTPGARRDYVEPGSGPLELEQLIINRLRERFRLRRVAVEKVGFDPYMGDDELVVLRLVPRG